MITLAVVEENITGMPRKTDSEKQLAPSLVLDPKLTGRMLASARVEAGFTATELARRMRLHYGEASPSATSISRYENGYTRIDLDTFLAMMLVLRTVAPQKRVIPAIRGASDRDLWKLLIDS